MTIAAGHPSSIGDGKTVGPSGNPAAQSVPLQKEVCRDPSATEPDILAPDGPGGHDCAWSLYDEEKCACARSKEDEVAGGVDRVDVGTFALSQGVRVRAPCWLWLGMLASSTYCSRTVVTCAEEVAWCVRSAPVSCPCSRRAAGMKLREQSMRACSLRECRSETLESSHAGHFWDVLVDGPGSSHHRFRNS